MKTSELLIKIRKNELLTQKQFADKLGIARITAHYYEKGKRRPSGKIMDRLKELYPKYFEDSSQKEEKELVMTDRVVANLLDQIDTLKEQINYMEKPTTNTQHEDMITAVVDEINLHNPFDHIVKKLDGVQANWDFLFYNSSQAMSVAKHGLITNVNKAFYDMLGYKQEEMIGKPIIKFIHPDEHELAIKSIKSHKANQVHRVKTKSGKYIKIQITAKNFGGKVKDNSSYSVALMEKVN
tara:strand:+ start:13 stop:729 length:717 start_codon:yes stop_codon:yes gene_type:complete